MPKISAKLKWGHHKGLNGGAKCRWGRFIGEFRQITSYNSKTVEDRCIVSISRLGSRICALSNGDVAGDLE